MQDIKTLRIYKPTSWDAAVAILQQFYAVGAVFEEADHPLGNGQPTES